MLDTIIFFCTDPPYITEYVEECCSLCYVPFWYLDEWDEYDIIISPPEPLRTIKIVEQHKSTQTSNIKKPLRKIKIVNISPNKDKPIDEDKPIDKDDVIIQLFIDEYCNTTSDSRVRSTPLYNAYKKWCIVNNLIYLTRIMFTKRIAKKYEKIRRSEGVFYKGISIPG